MSSALTDPEEEIFYCGCRMLSSGIAKKRKKDKELKSFLLAAIAYPGFPIRGYQPLSLG